MKFQRSLGTLFQTHSELGQSQIVWQIASRAHRDVFGSQYVLCHQIKKKGIKGPWRQNVIWHLDRLFKEARPVTLPVKRSPLNQKPCQAPVS